MKKVVFTFMCFVLISANSVALSGWVLQNSGTTENLVSVYFLNDNTGFAGGESSIRMTTNGGANWFTVLTTGGNSFYFLNNQTGLLLSGSFYKTTNGGYNWFPISTGTAGFNPVQMIDSSIGYGTQLNACNGSSLEMIKTTNGGQNWQDLNLANVSTQSNTFLFFDKSTAVVSEYYSVPPNTSYSVQRTTNGGVSWQFVPNTGTYFLGILSKIDAVTAYGVSFKYQSGIVTGRTTDKGASWTYYNISVPILANSVLAGVQFLNSSTGFLASGTYSGGSRIYKTTDAGLSWGISLDYPAMSLFSAVYFPSAQTGYAVGNNGTIFKTTDGGTVTGFTENPSVVPDHYSLSQNSPNPFNPNTVIYYQLPVAGFIQLKVYDVIGNEVETLVNEKQNAGSYSVSFEAASLPSGTYFYKLITEKFSETKKMVLIK